ncbi:MAG TPA: hypothetical protein VFJ74_03855 [Gemmatimonadaceae bacterium]|nr:hypothetical protein [Gemmatimonadaceae bacterium]
MTDANLRRGGRLALTLALALYGASYARDPSEGGLIDGLNLGIHETGHLVFGPFGEFIGFAGGTLMQLIMPLVFMGYFLRRRDRHAATVALWWVAQNLWNISVYVADARAEELPLVGGGEHDWAYMLGRLGWLARDTAIARGVYQWGIVLFGIATALGVLFAFQSGAAEPGEGEAMASASTATVAPIAPGARPPNADAA